MGKALFLLDRLLYGQEVRGRGSFGRRMHGFCGLIKQPGLGLAHVQLRWSL